MPKRRLYCWLFSIWKLILPQNNRLDFFLKRLNQQACSSWRALNTEMPAFNHWIGILTARTRQKLPWMVHTSLEFYFQFSSKIPACNIFVWSQTKRPATTGIFSSANFVNDDFQKAESVFFSKFLQPISWFLLFQKASDFSLFKPHNYGGRDIFTKKDQLIRILKQICHLYQLWNKDQFFF